MTRIPAKLAVVVGLVIAAIGAAPGDARAQAWVGAPGSVELGLDYNLGVSDKVIGDGDLEYEDAGTTTHQIALGAEYTPISRLAVSATLPLVFLKYTGDKDMYPHGGGGSYDDGDTHATLTDLRANVRYQVLEEPFALSPHIGFSIPVADYETVGNTVAGRHLKALHLGLGAGYAFGAAPTYVHLLYEFSLVEKYDRTAQTEQYGQNRSDLAFTVGHRLLGQKLDLHLDANARVTHGGLKFSEIEAGAPGSEFHDAILAETIVLVGGGIGYQLNDKLALSLAARLFVAGSNTQNASVLAAGLAWSVR